ncbi:MAG: hypothetical protein IKR23_04465 [Lachnospiraceae bacterium]|nr:hypothetical protein [Lachnospiraceae bacterium]
MEQAYIDWVFRSYKSRANRRSSILGEAILRERFSGKGSKRKKDAFRKSPEYREELKRRKENDEPYIFYSQIREMLKADVEYYELHSEWIGRMAEDGYDEFTEYVINNYRRKKENEGYAKGAFEKLGISDITELVAGHYADLKAVMRNVISDYLGTSVIDTSYIVPYDKRKNRDTGLNINNYEEYLSGLPDKSGWISFYYDVVILMGYTYPESPLIEYIRGIFEEALAADIHKRRKGDISYSYYNDISSACSKYIYDLSEKDSPLMTKAEALKLIRENPNYRGLEKKFNRIRQRELALKEAVLDHIPDNMIDLYPAARMIKRKFILHIGPTNSGKTYSAMQELIKAGSGIYLGPLRLLAYEQYEKLTDKGLSCNLITGEEEILNEDASFQASTIDVLDFKKGYTCAVIDEAQMLTDEFRGGRWTAAIIGIVADTVHVCAAPEAEELLVRMIKECGDDVEVEYHKRLSSLECDRDYCDFPDTVQKGDALIVFSRRSVHAIAAQLQRLGYKCSVIYGALPYDVRHEEARKFMEKETDVLVATDAIGMGLNLPIRRVVLMETSKFDGRERRYLLPAEIRQIVGRAGRAGVFDRGFYTVDINTNMMLDQLRKKVENRLPDIKSARIAFPESLLGIEGKVSELINQWDKIPVSVPFEKASSEREKKLAELLEMHTQDKQMIYELITIPYDESKPQLLERWFEFAIDLIKGRELHFRIGAGIDPVNDADELKEAELMYEALDLEYQLCKKYGEEETTHAIMMQKTVISAEINRFLATQALQEKECLDCRKPLPWDYVKTRCPKCQERYRKKRGRYY